MLLRYEITKQDLYVTKFPYSKVLQHKFNCEHGKTMYVEAKLIISEYIRTNLRKRDIVLVNEEIYIIVDTLKAKYPDVFEDIGWYSRQILGELYLQGRLTIDGIKAQQ
jgi:hypothetical protein